MISEATKRSGQLDLGNNDYSKDYTRFKSSEALPRL